MAKGLICGFLGILTATVGIDSVTSYIRFTDNANLLSGIQYIPVMIGLFAMSQAFETIEDIYSTDEIDASVTRLLPTKEDVKTILTPIIFILCVVGSYAMRSNFYDVGTMLIAGVIGWLMGKVKIPTSPAILGLILGPMAEKNFRTALLKSSGNPVVFFNIPICWFFLALIAFTLFGAVRGQLKKKN